MVRYEDEEEVEEFFEESEFEGEEGYDFMFVFDCFIECYYKVDFLFFSMENLFLRSSIRMVDFLRLYEFCYYLFL